jgi:nucleoside-diphosphate-sugar epimerase
MQQQPEVKPMTQSKTALILGATGGIGHEVAIALNRHGWQIKALHRDPTDAAVPGSELNVTWVRGDALNAAEVTNAAQGTSLIVHAVNPPGYRNWAQLVVPMIESSISAARASGARILLPGTIYNFGPDAFPTLREDSPQNPLTRKGKIRVEMERRLQAAAHTGVRSLIVRAGDFFGPSAGNNWFSQGLVRPGKQVTSIAYPGRRGAGHAWAYLPDLAETMAQLVDRESTLGTFEKFHFAGQWDPDGSHMTNAIRAVGGSPNTPVRRFPWPLVTLLSPFKTLFREMREMRYLWQEPLRLNNDRLLSVLGTEPHTPLEQAVRTTLAGLECLPPAARA